MNAWYKQTVTPPSEPAKVFAEIRQSKLTKPAGSLGKLEQLAVQLCSLQNTQMPKVDKVAIRVFAADHGVAAEGVSVFPQAVTVEMIKNFIGGGAAISVLAKVLSADFSAVNMGTVYPFEAEGLINSTIARGTKNFCIEPAMSAIEFERAMLAGKVIVGDVVAKGCNCFIGGEMGIGNTTTAAAMACAILNETPEEMVGLGTGIDDKGKQRKINVVKRALKLHCDDVSSLEQLARRLGGFEIIALAGAYTQCAYERLPILVDGFICSVAALLACRLNPGVREWLIFSHQSGEQGHARVLSAMEAEPLLDLKMRLGEASGAAVALPLLRMACDLHTNMATFSEAAVSESSALS